MQLFFRIQVAYIILLILFQTNQPLGLFTGHLVSGSVERESVGQKRNECVKNSAEKEKPEYISTVDAVWERPGFD